MGTIGLLGSILRFVFIFHLSYKKMQNAYIFDRKLEKKKDIIAGIIGLTLFFIFFIIRYEIYLSPKK